jgi:hypothetical protein
MNNKDTKLRHMIYTTLIKGEYEEQLRFQKLTVKMNDDILDLREEIAASESAIKECDKQIDRIWEQMGDDLSFSFETLEWLDDTSAQLMYKFETMNDETAAIEMDIIRLIREKVIDKQVQKEKDDLWQRLGMEKDVPIVRKWIR